MTQPLNLTLSADFAADKAIDALWDDARRELETRNALEGLSEPGLQLLRNHFGLMLLHLSQHVLTCVCDPAGGAGETFRVTARIVISDAAKGHLARLAKDIKDRFGVARNAVYEGKA